MYQYNLDLGVLQDTNITYRLHIRDSEGYHALAADILSRHHGGVDILYRDVTHFQVKVYHPHGTNVAILQMVYDGRLWFVLGCYLAQDNASMIEIIKLAINQIPSGTAIILDSGFNSELDSPEGNLREEDIAVVMTTTDLKDMVTHFPPHHKALAQAGRTW